VLNDPPDAHDNTTVLFYLLYADKGRVGGKSISTRFSHGHQLQLEQMVVKSRVCFQGCQIKLGSIRFLIDKL
jgi:hypothetical protein